MIQGHYKSSVVPKIRARIIAGRLRKPATGIDFLLFAVVKPARKTLTYVE